MNVLRFLFCSILVGSLAAQKQANVWHFGAGLSLDFNAGVAVQTTGSPIFTIEGSTSYCDDFGNLLFFSNGGGRAPMSGQDGGKIWNKNNQIIYDMQGMEGGGWSASQSSVIVPAPGNDQVYYLFTMEEMEHYIDATPQVLAAEPNGRGFRYFKVDMEQNGGLGAVTEADVQLFDHSFEGLCAIKHSNESDYWVLIYHDTTGIGVYSVTQNGVQLSAVYSIPVSSSGGIIKAAPSSYVQGQSCCTKVMTQSGVFDFDLTSGVLTFETNLNAKLPTYFEFSPNGQYLYATIFDPASSNSQLLRYNIELAKQSGQTLESTEEVIAPSFRGLYMQLAPDGRIYYIEPSFDFSATKLGAIQCPNSSIPSLVSDVFTFPIDAQNPFGFYSLPNFSSWIFYNKFNTHIEFGPDTLYLCAGDSLILFAGDGTSWSWGGDASLNEGPYFTVTAPGVYSATVSGPCGSGSDQIRVLLCDTLVEGEVAFPNIFTPNSDGLNDFFEIENLPNNSAIFIYNRWGNVVFHASDYQNNWNGKNSFGADLVEGVYTYKLVPESGEEGFGFVHIIR